LVLASWVKSLNRQAISRRLRLLSDCDDGLGEGEKEGLNDGFSLLGEFVLLH